MPDSEVLHLLSVNVFDRVGVLARLARSLAKAGVNVDGFIADSSGIHIVTGQDAAAHAAIHGVGAKATSMPVVHVDIPNRPGALAELCEKLASAGVSIQLAVGAGNGFAGRVYLQLSDVRLAGPILASVGMSTGKAKPSAAKAAVKAKPAKAAKKSPAKKAAKKKTSSKKR